LFPMRLPAEKYHRGYLSSYLTQILTWPYILTLKLGANVRTHDETGRRLRDSYNGASPERTEPQTNVQ